MSERAACEQALGIVVLTWNRCAEVLRTLARLSALALDVPIVVVDNGSTDDTATAIAREFPAVTVVRLPRNFGAAGRNAGVEALDRPYIAFCDDDTWWTPGALEHAVAVLDAHPRLAAVTARVRVEPSGVDDPTSTRMRSSPFPNVLGVPGTELFGLLAGACVMRRAAYREAGGFERRFVIGGEEGLLAIDLKTLGWHMAYLPDAVVCHAPSLVRNPTARRRLQSRNRMWCACLRRTWRAALRTAREELGAAVRNGNGLATAASTLAGMGWVLRERRVAPQTVQDALAELDAFVTDMEAQERSVAALGPTRFRSSSLQAATSAARPVEGLRDSTRPGRPESPPAGWAAPES